ncbi:MAG: ornithine aminomutase subunit alpha [Christensenellales bacterium]|jgi:D-ornithine 4,5-aminomutase subunit alpha
MKRTDDYTARAAHLKGLSDEALYARFWELAKELTDPLLEMGREYTSPSIERSVLLRMGFSSLEAGALVGKCLEHGLLGHGAGHVVFKAAGAWGLGIREAGQRLIALEDWQDIRAMFRKGARHG